MLNELCLFRESLNALALGQAYAHAMRITHQTTLSALGLYPEIDQPLLQRARESATEPERNRIALALHALLSAHIG